MATKTTVKKTRGKYIELMVRCPRCRNVQYEYVYSLDEKPYFKCLGCGVLVPSGAWTVTYFCCGDSHS